MSKPQSHSDGSTAAQTLVSVRWARGILLAAVPIAVVFLFVPGMSADVMVPISAARDLAVPLDKLGHFCGAMTLTWLLVIARPLGARRGGAVTWLVVTVGLALAAGAIEWTQLLVSRGYELGDMIAHWLGQAVGLMLLATALLIVRLIKPSAKALAIAGPRIGVEASATANPVTTDGDGQTPTASSPSGTDPASPAIPASTVSSSTTAATHTESRRFVGAAVVVSVLTFLSRLTGLARDAYLASAFGVSGVSDAFWTGFLVPNLFRRLFGEGALTAAFIPAYTTLLRQDKQLARRFASAVLAFIAIILGSLTIVGEFVLAGALASRGWTPDTSLAIRLTMVMLPYMPLVCLVALIGSMLQVHGKFAPAAGMPIFLNVVMIVGTYVALRYASGRHGPAGSLGSGEPDDPLRLAVYVVSISVVIAGFVQLVAQGTMLLRHESFTTSFHGIKPAFTDMARAFLPMLLALAVFQINTFFDTLIAFGLSPKEGGPAMLELFGKSLHFPVEAGGVTAMNNAQRLYQFPLGVFGLAIATAIFPALSHAAADTSPAGHQQFRRILQNGLRLTVFIGLPACAGLIVCRVSLARTLFERGLFKLDDSMRVAEILMGFAPAIWAYSMTHVITRAFYALRDSRTPLVISIVMVIANFILNCILVWPLGVAGLAWATAICAIVQNLLLLAALGNYIERPVDAAVMRGWLRTIMLTALMTASLLPITSIYDPAQLSRWGAAMQLAGMVALGVTVFTAGAWVLGAEEVGWLRRRRAHGR